VGRDTGAIQPGVPRPGPAGAHAADPGRAATGPGLSATADPDLAQTQEPYAYAGGDPVINTDPTGDELVFAGWMFGYTNWIGGDNEEGSIGWVSKHLGIDINLGVVQVHVNNVQVALSYWIAVFRW
jgi:hypothetical protein